MAPPLRALVIAINASPQIIDDASQFSYGLPSLLHLPSLVHKLSLDPLNI
jgi:hypothetical protein